MDSIPNWVNLLPPGPDLVARDGRNWTYDPAQVIAAFLASGGPLPIDYEHAQDILAPKGEAAPAVGWIVEMTERGNALWGKVEWTKRGAASVSSREYRFVSAAMKTDAQNRVLALAGAALVNRPALHVAPIFLKEAGTYDQQRAAELARQATDYQAQQAALGRNITLIEAVAAVAGEASDLSRN